MSLCLTTFNFGLKRQYYLLKQNPVGEFWEETDEEVWYPFTMLQWSRMSCFKIAYIEEPS